MGDNKQNTGNPDRNMISLSEKYEVEYWANKFNVTPEQLRQAIEAVGSRAKNVEEYLQKAGA